MKKSKTKLSTVVEAQADIITGATNKEIKDRYGVSKSSVALKTAKINEIINSDMSEDSLEKRIITEAISDRLKPIKSELATKSLEIIRKTDDELLYRLENQAGLIDEKVLVNISDTFSKRLSRLVALDEDPNAGIPVDSRNKTTNVFIQNIFKEHNEMLEKKRNNINKLWITPETPINKG
jgi:hypothetical protein